MLSLSMDKMQVAYLYSVLSAWSEHLKNNHEGNIVLLRANQEVPI